MNIGAAAAASGVSAKMIRYYEDISLIPRTHRSSSGYRTYSETDVQRLRFIRRARDLGFPVAEIQTLLGLWSDRKRKSADVKHLAQAQIAELEHRIENLRQMVETLQTLVSACAGDQQPDCPILAELESSETTDCGHKPAGREALPPPFPFPPARREKPAERT